MKDPVTGKDLIYKDYNGELDDASFRDVSPLKTIMLVWLVVQIEELSSHL